MFKEKLFSITGFGISFIIIAAVILFFFIYSLICELEILTTLIFWVLMSSLFHFILGLGILKLKPWARRLLFTPHWFIA